MGYIAAYGVTAFIFMVAMLVEYVTHSPRTLKIAQTIVVLSLLAWLIIYLVHLIDIITNGFSNP